MKQKTLTNPRLWIPVLAVAFTIALVSWDQKQTPGDQRQQYNAADTTPKKKTDKKVRDLDDVMYELDMADFKLDMEKMQQELAKAMKEIDGQKIKLDIEKAMKDIDFSKIQKEVQESLAKIDWDKMKAEVDFDKIQKEVKESMAKINWDDMKKELDEVKNIDMKKLDEEMKKMKEELEKIGPQIKEEMEKAKVEVEKAKAEIKEYKEFVDGLEKDGLLNKKENYTIKHQDGELTVNGKKVSEQTYSKYRNFLEKHKKFSIEKDDDDFDIDMD
jgi:copper chaperone CopZ